MVTLCQFIDAFIKQDGNGQAFQLEDHQRGILGEAFRCDETERFVYKTIIYSAPKRAERQRSTPLFACGGVSVSKHPMKLL